MKILKTPQNDSTKTNAKTGSIRSIMALIKKVGSVSVTVSSPAIPVKMRYLPLLKKQSTEKA